MIEFSSKEFISYILLNYLSYSLINIMISIGFKASIIQNRVAAFLCIKVILVLLLFIPYGFTSIIQIIINFSLKSKLSSW